MISGKSGLWVLLFFLLFGGTGCSSDDDIQTFFRVRALNLSPNSPVQNIIVGDLSFTSDFSGGAAFSAAPPAELTFEVRGFVPADDITQPPEDTLIMIPAQTLNFEAGMDYTIITFGDADDLQSEIYVNPTPEGFTTNIAEFQIANISTSGSVDIFFTDVDSNLTTETPDASLNFREVSPVFERETGEFQIRVTEAGTQNVIFTSDPQPLFSAQKSFFVVSDTPLALGSPLRVFQLDDATSAQLADADTEALVRVLQLSPDTSAIDVFANDEMLESPLVEDVSFGDLTAYVEFPSDTVDIDITPAGDTSTVLLENQIATLVGTEHTYLLTGLSGNLEGRLLLDSTRSIATEVRFRAVHGTTLLDDIDFFITTPDTVIDNNSLPLAANFGRGQVTGVIGAIPGDYDITGTTPGTEDIVLGPTTITLVEGGVYTLALRDSDAGDVVDFMLINDQ